MSFYLPNPLVRATGLEFEEFIDLPLLSEGAKLVDSDEHEPPEGQQGQGGPRTPSSGAKAHYAAWVHRPNEPRGRVFRYAWSGDSMVCFGDGPLADLRDGEHVFVDLGRPNVSALETEFAATVWEVDSNGIDREIIEALAEHMPLGGSLHEVENALTRLRERRLLALKP